MDKWAKAWFFQNAEVVLSSEASLVLSIMPVAVDIGMFIERSPALHSGRPVIAGAGTSVCRIAVLYKEGLSGEEISRRMKHLLLAQVYAALTYYYANRAEIEADLAEEEAEYWKLVALHSTEAR